MESPCQDLIPHTSQSPGYEYDPATERWVRLLPGALMPCQVTPLKDDAGNVVTKVGLVVGWCATHGTTAWVAPENL